MPELTKHTLTVDGLEREFWMHIPDNATAHPPALVSCHGGGANGQVMGTKFASLYDKGIVMVFPTATFDTNHGKTRWITPGEPNVPDSTVDEKFLTLLNAMLRGRGVPGEHLVAGGFSSGGKMALWMSLFQSAMWSGFFVAGRTYLKPWLTQVPSEPRPLFFQCGTDDPHAWDEGFGFTSFLDAAKHAIALNGGDLGTYSQETVPCCHSLVAKMRTYPGGTATTQPVVIPGGGHEWFNCPSYRTHEKACAFLHSQGAL